MCQNKLTYCHHYSMIIYCPLPYTHTETSNFVPKRFSTIVLSLRVNFFHEKLLAIPYLRPYSNR